MTIVGRRIEILSYHSYREAKAYHGQINFFQSVLVLPTIYSFKFAINWPDWNFQIAKKFMSNICECLYVVDMTFDDDTKLFGLMRRYSDSEEAEELKRQVIEYVRT